MALQSASAVESCEHDQNKSCHSDRRVLVPLHSAAETNGQHAQVDDERVHLI